MDGSGRRGVVGNVSKCYGLTLLGDFIYWTDWWPNVVERAHKLTGRLCRNHGYTK